MSNSAAIKVDNNIECGYINVNIPDLNVNGLKINAGNIFNFAMKPGQTVQVNISGISCGTKYGMEYSNTILPNTFPLVDGYTVTVSTVPLGYCLFPGICRYNYTTSSTANSTAPTSKYPSSGSNYCRQDSLK